ncbi:hypothetical protein H9Y04_35170 [Streptomyces sp. TRM66268-LWL]|uniref:Uncharacterized protein n=1 Tax=Streptomyces polyasparticus TaxID=2767826 RepID=A0ABR7SQL0_9ACTN|nr:hypothetical protein [Streptomyces polyasparticus]MBC9717785.1 hypothetical protein [Streptomyces polyasparticus]
MTLTYLSAVSLLRKADEDQARALYADVIEALEDECSDVGVDFCGNELTVTIQLTSDGEQYIAIAGRYSLPWHDDRSELGGWSAVHIDNTYGTAKVIYDSTTPEGEPSGDLDLEPLAEEVGSYVKGWHAEHS